MGNGITNIITTNTGSKSNVREIDNASYSHAFKRLRYPNHHWNLFGMVRTFGFTLICSYGTNFLERFGDGLRIIQLLYSHVLSTICTCKLFHLKDGAKPQKWRQMYPFFSPTFTRYPTHIRAMKVYTLSGGGDSFAHAKIALSDVVTRPRAGGDPAIFRNRLFFGRNRR